MLGQGNLDRGLRKLIKNRREMTDREREMYETKRDKRDEWIRLLRSHLIDNGFNEQDVAALVNHHQYDYLRPLPQLMRAGLALTRQSYQEYIKNARNGSGDSNEGGHDSDGEVGMKPLSSSQQLTLIAQSITSEADSSNAPFCIRLLFISSAWEYKNNYIQSFESGVGRKATAKELQEIFEVHCKAVDAEDRGGGTVVSEYMRTELQRLIDREKRKETLDKELRQASQNKYSLFGDIPRISHEKIQEWIAGSSHRTSVKDIVAMLDREIPFKQLLEDLGYDYSGIPIQPAIESFIRTGKPHTGSDALDSKLTNIYAAVNYTVGTLERMINCTSTQQVSLLFRHNHQQQLALIKDGLNSGKITHLQIVDRKLRRGIFERDLSTVKELLVKRFSGKRTHDETDDELEEQETESRDEQDGESDDNDDIVENKDGDDDDDYHEQGKVEEDVQPQISRRSSRKRQRFSSYHSK